MARVSSRLARGPAEPDGNTEDRLDLHMPLTPQAQIDVGAFAASSEPWRYRREMPGGKSRSGELIQTESGWALRRIGEEDDPLWGLESSLFRPGDYFTLRSPRDEELVFLIVDVAPD